MVEEAVVEQEQVARPARALRPAGVLVAAAQAEAVRYAQRRLEAHDG